MSEYTPQDLLDNLNYLDETKKQIKQAIVDKGQPISDTDSFRSYVDKIDKISTLAEETADATATAEDILKGKTAYNAEGKIEGTLIPTEDLQEQLDTQDAIIQQLQEELSNKSSYDCNYYNARLVPTNDTITTYITKISPQLDTSSVTNMSNMFYGCTNLTTIPLLNTINVTNMSHMFNGCTNLTTIPLLNTSNVTNMNSMFSNCSSLSDESLNNILAMCTNATKITSGKTLNQIGLTRDQATRCQSLSNYEAFTAAGWTTGY